MEKLRRHCRVRETEARTTQKHLSGTNSRANDGRGRKKKDNEKNRPAGDWPQHSDEDGDHWGE